jgi:hypothetical protein
MADHEQTLNCGEPCIFCGYAEVAELVMDKNDRRERVRFCAKCEKVWEPEHRDKPAKQMCNNCAFRPGSPERSAPDSWRQLREQSVEAGQPFACHKDMPAVVTPGTGYRFLGADLERDKVTYCAGWLAHRCAWLAMQADEKEPA